MDFAIDCPSNAGGSTNRGSDDSYGRALWGLGTACCSFLRCRPQTGSAYELFWSNYRLESSTSPARSSMRSWEQPRWQISMTRSMLRNQIRMWIGQLPGPSRRPWMWPHHELTYDNARYPEALMTAGHRPLRRPLDQGWARAPDWLVEIESSDWRALQLDSGGGRTVANLDAGEVRSTAAGGLGDDRCRIGRRVARRASLVERRRTSKILVFRPERYRTGDGRYGHRAGFDGLTNRTEPQPRCRIHSRSRCRHVWADAGPSALDGLGCQAEFAEAPLRSLYQARG